MAHNRMTPEELRQAANRILSHVTAIVGEDGFYDPERQLWVPGRKTIFLPQPTILNPAFMVNGIALGSGILRCDVSHDVIDVTQLGDMFRRFVPSGDKTVIVEFYPEKGAERFLPSLLDATSSAKVDMQAPGGGIRCSIHDAVVTGYRIKNEIGLPTTVEMTIRSRSR